ncbi:MAG: Ig-like domain-containing protein [Vicinamibacterales bacterium]
MRPIPCLSSVRVIAACGLALAAACSGGGGGGGGVTAPGSTAPTISTSNTVIFIGQSVTFAATGGGTIRWGGDNPAVATVEATTGRVTGVGNGRVTIWAENDGGRTTRLLRGLPSYAGSWQGNYDVVQCVETGDFTGSGFCQAFTPGQGLQLQLTLTQTDDRVTGSFVFGTAAPGALNASTVAEDGSLPATGLWVSGEVTVRIENTRLESPSAGTMAGTFDQIWTVAGTTGSGLLRSQLTNMTRTSGGPAFGLTAPHSGPMTLDDVIRRFSGR